MNRLQRWYNSFNFFVNTVEKNQKKQKQMERLERNQSWSILISNIAEKGKRITNIIDLGGQ